MGAGEGARSAGGPGGARGPPGGPSSMASWMVLGVVGVLLFAVGVWNPAWKGVSYGVELGFLFDIVGAALLVLGFTFAYRAHTARRPTPIEELPGVTVFSPNAPVPDEASAGESAEGGEHPMLGEGGP
jgi:hypothetical protein